jgi:translation factor GUF1, mitochondrial
MKSHIYVVIYRERTVFISNPTEFPDVTDIGTNVKAVQEPIVRASIIVPEGWPGDFFKTSRKLTAISTS